MGRKKIAIQPIIDERNRNVTFNKRKNGLIKKAMELSILCNCNISLVIFNTENQLYEYCSTDPRFILQHYCQVAHLPHERLSNADYYQRFDRRSSSASSIDKKKVKGTISVHDDEGSASSSSATATGTSLGSEGSIDEDDYDDDDFDDEMVGTTSTGGTGTAATGGTVTSSGGIGSLGVLGATPTTASGGVQAAQAITPGLMQQRRASLLEAAMAAAAAAGAGGGAAATHQRQQQQQQHQASVPQQHLDFSAMSTSSAPMPLHQQQQQLNLEQAASLYNTISASNALLSAAAAAAAAASNSGAAQQAFLPSTASSASGGGSAGSMAARQHHQTGFSPALFNLQQLNPLRFQADAFGLAQQAAARQQRRQQLLHQQRQHENAVGNLVQQGSSNTNANNIIKPEVVTPSLYSIEEIKRMLNASTGNSAATAANGTAETSAFAPINPSSGSNSATVNVEKQG